MFFLVSLALAASCLHAAFNRSQQRFDTLGPIYSQRHFCLRLMAGLLGHMQTFHESLMPYMNRCFLPSTISTNVQNSRVASSHKLDSNGETNQESLDKHPRESEVGTRTAAQQDYPNGYVSLQVSSRDFHDLTFTALAMGGGKGKKGWKAQWRMNRFCSSERFFLHLCCAGWATLEGYWQGRWNPATVFKTYIFWVVPPPPKLMANAGQGLGFQVHYGPILEARLASCDDQSLTVSYGFHCPCGIQSPPCRHHLFMPSNP